MRYPASEKLEIIRLVEQSHLPVRRTLEKLGIPRATFSVGTICIRPAGRKPWTTARRERIRTLATGPATGLASCSTLLGRHS
jgi:hypothetical protein